MKHIALGVNIGNLSRGKRPREPMRSRCERINRSLAGKGVDLRVIGFYRHTGSLVLETTTLQSSQAAQVLSEADGGTWMAVSEATMRKAVEEVRKMPSPEREEGVRWTPGLAFAVTEPRGAAAALHRPKFAFVQSTSIRLRRGSAIESPTGDDSTTKCAKGGWGAVSGALADQTNSQWTARSLTTLEGVLGCANPMARWKVSEFGETLTKDGAVLLSYNLHNLLRALLDRPKATATSVKDWITAAEPYRRTTYWVLRKSIRHMNPSWIRRTRVGRCIRVALQPRGRAILDGTVRSRIRRSTRQSWGR